MVWRGVREVDCDKNGFLMAEELENCFREFYATELDGKSLSYYFREFGTDHDKSLVNYKKIKENVL